MLVSEKVETRRAIGSMPGVFQLSVAEAEQAGSSGLPAVLLLGIPAEKDEAASAAYAERGIVREAIRVMAEADALLLQPLSRRGNDLKPGPFATNRVERGAQRKGPGNMVA